MQSDSRKIVWVVVAIVIAIIIVGLVIWWMNDSRYNGGDITLAANRFL